MPEGSTHIVQNAGQDINVDNAGEFMTTESLKKILNKVLSDISEEEEEWMDVHVEDERVNDGTEKT